MANPTHTQAQSRRNSLSRTIGKTLRNALLYVAIILGCAGYAAEASATWVSSPVLAQSNIAAGPSGDTAAAPTTEGAPQGGPGQQQPSQVPFLIMMVAIFGFFYFFIIRPQNKQQKEHERLVKELKKGDQVITQGGLFGRISDFDDTNKAIVLEVSKGVRIKMLRTQVARLQGTEPAANDKKPAKGRS